MTYPNTDVAKFISESFVPVQLDVNEKEAELEPWAVHWTPSLVVLDAEGRQHRRLYGYHSPHALIAELALARVCEAVEREEAGEGRERAREALERCRGDRDREPEARYLAAVADYKATHDAKLLMAGWNELIDLFPESAWADKASFIRE